MDNELQRLRAQKLAELQAQQKVAAPRGVVEAKDEDFASLVAHGTVFVDMWATWCGPCRVFGPVFEKVAKETGGDAVFAKMDVDRNRLTAMQHQVQSIPTLLVFKEGRLVHRQAGALPEGMLRKLVGHFT